jgi:hypothetical protein
VSIGHLDEQGPFLATWALLDSGSGRTLLPAHLMARLGVKREDCEPYTVIGANTAEPVWRSPVKVPIAIGGFLVQTQPFFKTWLPFPIVLGRFDVFCAFDVEISGRDQEVRLYPHDLPFVGGDTFTVELERLGPAVCEVGDAFDVLPSADTEVAI